MMEERDKLNTFFTVLTTDKSNGMENMTTEKE
jgi:hypothetical protein